MPRRILTTLATIGLGTAFFVTTVEEAQAQSATRCSERYNLAWEMPLTGADVGQNPQTVFSRSGFSLAKKVVNRDNRMAIGRAPDGTVGLQMNIPKGENRSIDFFVDPLGKPGVDAACLSVQMYMQSGFQWPASGGSTKLGWGLWGGDQPSKVSGGVPPNQQLGWSARNVNTIWGFRSYSYHLNRPERFGQSGTALARWGSSDWQAGRWHTVELEVVMNDPGKSNGYQQLWLDGKNRQTMTNQMFRRDRNWAIRGLMFSDIWGGTTSDPKNFSLKNQKMWYANYKIYAGSGSNPPPVAEAPPPSNEQSDGDQPPVAEAPPPSNDDSGSGSGSFGAVAPSGNIGGRNIVVQWRPDAKASKYYLKVETRQTKKAVYGASAWSNACNGSLCSITIPSLPAGELDWMVRPEYNGVNGTYSKLPINVVDANAQAGTPSTGQSDSDSNPPPVAELPPPSNGDSDSGSNPPPVAELPPPSNDDSGSGSSSFGAVAPSGAVGRNVVVQWRPDTTASKYYIKVENRKTKKAVYGGSAWPNACNGSVCSKNISNLPSGQLDWMVRPEYNGVNGTYSKLSLDVM